ncbi:MerR family transcriptional regulator [Dactylosporangium cerinum]
MTPGVTIGEFSRLCHLSAKTLRYYHDIELLVPAGVDGTGYRRYAPGQVDDAHLIRRLRDLDMPIAEIRGVLAEPDPAARQDALARHLDRMEAELTRTRDVVASLRRLLGSGPDLPVRYRRAPGSPVLRMSARLARTEVTDFCRRVYPEMYAILGALGTDPAGPAGATYSAEFFEGETGDVVAFVPVAASAVPPATTVSTSSRPPGTPLPSTVDRSATVTSPTAGSACTWPSTTSHCPTRSSSSTSSDRTRPTTRTSSAPRSAGPSNLEEHFA